MREIKFRAWDRALEKMHETITLTHEDGGCTYPNRYIHGDDALIYSFGGNLLLMQYTGLKDINGVEIYEGDILSNGMVNPKLVLVVYRKDRFDCKAIKNMRCLYTNLAIGCGGFKVIGNKYENPELLEKQQ